jgi:hypothetical protein
LVWARKLVCRTIETMRGPIQLELPYFYCRSCRVGCYPFDEAAGVVAGCKQLDMQKAVAQVVTEVPYDTAQSLFRDLTGLSFGSERLHTLTNQVCRAPDGGGRGTVAPGDRATHCRGGSGPLSPSGDGPGH